MKLREISVVLAAIGIVFMTPSSAVGAAQPPVPKLERTISLGHTQLIGMAGQTASTVETMSFSPDGRYLGIVESTSDDVIDIVVWNVERNKEQTRIRCGRDDTDSTLDRLLWLQGGKVVTFGAGAQWDAMTGNRLADNAAMGAMARLNKDGTRMLTVSGAPGEPSTIHVYDVKTWAEQNVDAGGLHVDAASWTSDDKVMVTVEATSRTNGTTVDGHSVEWDDTALRLLDPAGKTAAKGVWFNAIKTGNPQWPTKVAFPVDAVMVPNFATNSVFLDSGRIIDGRTLAVRPYRSFYKDDVSPGGLGMALSPDGKWLYLKGAVFADPTHPSTKNSIVDTASGLPVLPFTGGDVHAGDMAASPDGRWLAVGDEDSVFMFDMK